MYLVEKVMFKFNVVSLEQVLLPLLLQFSLALSSGMSDSFRLFFMLSTEFQKLSITQN